jgi:hypothetical protein
MRRVILSWFSTFALIAALAGASEVHAQQVQLTGEAKGSNEVPPLQSAASGSAVASYDPATRTLSWTITYSGLSTRPTAMHFHGPADSTRNAGIALLIPGNLDSPIMGSAVLSESQAADLLAGRWYLNIHTAAHPAGELRAQMTR